ncbi:MAG: ATP-binding cassette domain-containing protein, partial [Eubacteriales bacterium]|nr:ATP-binding cassette domain-containing protein [Eubacteriales bacterium]
LDAFDSGYYKLNDFSIESDKFNRYSDLRSKLLGFVFQSYHLIDSLSITDNILLPFIYSDEYITSEIIERMNMILESFDLIESKDKKTALLSGGEKQRVAIARAIIKSPPLVIADEPTGNLDNENTDVVIGYLKNLTKKSTSVIMVTHDTGLLKYSDRNYLLYEGRLV